MKVFAPLATALGVSSAAPTMQQQHNNMAGYHNMGNNIQNNIQMNNQMVSSMSNNRMAMNNRQMNGFDNMMSGKQRMSAGVDRQMYSNNMMSNNNMMMQQAGMNHGNNMMSNDRHMNNQMASNMRDMHNRNSMSMYSNNMNNMHQNNMNMNNMHQNNMNMNNMHSNNMNKQMTMKQTFGVEDRPAFYKQDDFGNFAYGYNSGNSEQFVMGNPEEGVKGHYTYVDGNGLNRRVEYVADNEGFRIIKDSDRSGMRFRREAEAEPAMTMTSVMDSSLMRNDDHQIQRSSLMPTMSMYRNMMASDRHNMNNQMSYPMNINMNNMLDGRHQQSMSSDRHMSDMRMSDRQMSDRQMYRNIMMGDNMMNNRNMMMQEDNMRNNMMNNRNMMMQEDNMRNNMMSNVMNHNIYNINNLDSMNMDNMNMNNMQMRNMENLDDGLLHERNTMAQRMEVERIPENAMTYFYF